MVHLVWLGGETQDESGAKRFAARSEKSSGEYTATLQLVYRLRKFGMLGGRKFSTVVPYVS